jgi:two-component system osmolarity sensor histidine kinase EnvZ
VAIAVTTAGRQWLVDVEDQGPGIPCEAREQVFERFWRSRDQGGHSGLGLTIARSIARSHGGDLSVADCAPGHCVLQVRLPRSSSPS